MDSNHWQDSDIVRGQGVPAGNSKALTRWMLRVVTFSCLDNTRSMNSRKTSGSGTTRKPPVPTDSHVEIEAWMKGVMPALQPIVNHIDETVRAALPDLQYAIKWKKVYYGLPKLGWVIEMVAYDVSVNVVFLGGADFDTPPPQGSGQSRYIKLNSLDEAQEPALRQWIEQAGRVPGWQ